MCAAAQLFLLKNEQTFYEGNPCRKNISQTLKFGEMEWKSECKWLKSTFFTMCCHIISSYHLYNTVDTCYLWDLLRSVVVGTLILTEMLICPSLFDFYIAGKWTMNCKMSSYWNKLCQTKSQWEELKKSAPETPKEERGLERNLSHKRNTGDAALQLQT